MKNTLGTKYVTDTMGFVLRLEHRRLGEAGRRAFDEAEAGKATMFVPAMVLAEILYLSEKNRIQARLKSALSYMSRHPAVKERPLDTDVMRSAAGIRDISELHDRLIAATAVTETAALVTNDPEIAASSSVRTLW